MKGLFFFLCFAVIAPLCAEVKVLAFAGSAREGSYNRLLVKEASEIARQLGATVTLIDLKDYPMPFYDADLEQKKGLPIDAKRFRQLVLENDGIIIASPEYNSSFSALVKNAIDWASRSDGASRGSAFKGKKVALMSASPGKSGGARGLLHLEVVMKDVKADVAATKTLVPFADEAFDAAGKLKDPALRQKLKKEVEELVSP